MATYSQRVTVGANDGHWEPDDNNFTTGDTTLLNNGSTVANNWYHIWMRFTGVDIPAGSTINSASITLSSIAGFAGNTDHTLVGVAEANPTAPTSKADANGRSLTTATVAQSAFIESDPLTSATSDISSIITELIGLGSWASGNSMLIYMKSKQDANLVTQFRSSEYDAANATTLAPQLNIDYTAPAAGASGSPLRSPFLRNPTNSPFIRV